jgi:hypothetical protein
VKAAKIEHNFINAAFPPGFEDVLVTSEKMKQYPGQNIFDILSITTAFKIVKNMKKEDGTFGTRFSIDGRLCDPGVIVGNNSWAGSIDDLNFLNSDEVESISVFKIAYSITIVIRLKKWEDRKSQTPISLTKVTPLGYQKPAEFYVPKYNVDSVRLSEKADLRTTIYWNPKLETDDNGNVHVSFYTADKANNYSVVMEGITIGGEICRYVGLLKREDK